MFGGINMGEILIILVVVLVLFGSKKLPEIGSGFGRAIKNFKKATSEPDEIDITPTKKKTKAGEDDEA
jgi:sec-independent protein translocase protein TatA